MNIKKTLLITAVILLSVDLLAQIRTRNPFVENSFQLTNAEHSIMWVDVDVDYTMLLFELTTSVDSVWIGFSENTTLWANNKPIKYFIEEWGVFKDDFEAFDFNVKYFLEAGTHIFYLIFPEIPAGIERISIRDFTGNTDFFWNGIQINNLSVQPNAEKNIFDRFNFSIADLLVQQGRDFSRQKNYMMAIDKYKQALQIAPNHYWANNNLGYDFFLVGDCHRAIHHLRRAVEIWPENPFAYNNLSNCYVKLGEYEKAIFYARKTIKLRDDYNLLNQGKHSIFNFGRPYYNIARAYIGLNNQEKALPYLMEAVRLGEEDAKKLLVEMENKNQK